ncbi:MAG TPA: sulfotransferase [Pseudomonadales bacterium]|nr:sulfotransferase [Pseudomonadales bacterium]
MSGSVDQHLAEAERLHRAGDLEAAARAYAALAEVAPALADPWYGLGTIALQTNRPEAALDPLVHATRLAPERPEIGFNLGLARAAAGQVEGAVEALSAAAETALDDRPLLGAITRKLLALGAPRNAWAVLRRIDHADLDLALIAAEARAGAGDWGGALTALREIVARAPRVAEAQRSLAQIAARLRDYGRALDAYDRYLELVTPCGDDHLRHADLLLMARRATDAAAATERARALGVRGPDLELLAARCARLQGDYDASDAFARAALAGRPHDGDAWQLRIELAADADLPALLERTAPLLTRADLPPRHHLLIALAAGRAHERLGDARRAFACFATGNRMHHEALRARGEAYDPAAMAAQTERIISTFPGPLPASAPAAPTPLFVLGMPRSGTTLVERILGTFDGVATGGENEALEFVTNQYGFDLARGRVPAPEALTPAQWQGLANAYWAHTGGDARRLTDKMPHNFRHVGFIAAMFPEAPILWLRRDPRDVCLSIFTRPFPDGHAYACELTALAHFFAQSERLRRHWAQTLPGRVLEVDYRRLVADPETETRRIAEHCGLTWTAACLRFHERTDTSYTFSELQVRRPINDEGIGRWQAYGAELAPLLEALAAEGVELPSAEGYPRP